MIFEETEVRAILNQGAFFEGKLSFYGTVRIAGQFKGEIQSEGTLIIDSTAKVEAKINIKTLILTGHLSGEVCASEQVKMFPPAHFKGEVVSPSLKIEEGVIFEGSSRHHSQNIALEKVKKNKSE